MYYFFLTYYEGDLFKEGKTASKALFLTGLFFGLAISVKWTALYSFAGICLLFAYVKICEFMEYTDTKRIWDLPPKIKSIYETDFLKRFFFPHMDVILISLLVSFFT